MHMTIMRRRILLGLSIAAIGWFFPSTRAHAGLPYPDVLDRAAVAQPQVADINREGLVLGNGDLSVMLWQRNGVLCIRVTKNDVWDARVDTSNDPPMMRVDIPNQKWSGGIDSPQSWNNGYPSPRCAAITRIGKDADAGGWRTIRSVEFFGHSKSGERAENRISRITLTGGAAPAIPTCRGKETSPAPMRWRP